MSSSAAGRFINRSLPDQGKRRKANKNGVEFIKKILKESLPAKDHKKLEEESVSYTYILDKQKSKGKAVRPRKRKNFLTRKERAKLGLLKLPKKNEWNYDSLQGMRDMWKDYMRENLDVIRQAPKCSDPEWISFSAVLMKSELVGAEVVVVRSKTPSLVDIGGTIVLETKATFQIVTKNSQLKIILKEHSVFEITLDGLKFVIFGKHLLMRPGERSVKKIKLHMLPDLS